MGIALKKTSALCPAPHPVIFLKSFASRKFEHQPNLKNWHTFSPVPFSLCINRAFFFFNQFLNFVLPMCKNLQTVGKEMPL